MHKSKLGGFIIGCQTGDLDFAANFCGAALGMPVRRLEKLGAKRIAAIQTWVVMEAPTGQRFCVVRANSKHFDQQATQWP